jgi:Methyltransferase domain
MSEEYPRTILPFKLNEWGLTGIGVEVGVCEGKFSEHILTFWPGRLFLVDPWLELEDYKEQYDHEENYRETLKRVAPWKDRVTIVRKTSQQAAEEFLDGRLDFVYLDANHSYSCVLDDLYAWWPKLKVGGLFAGDDYGVAAEQLVDFGRGRVLFGVKRAVDEFAERHDRVVNTDWNADWKVGDTWAKNWYFFR